MPPKISDAEQIGEMLNKWNKRMTLFLLLLICPIAFSTFAAIMTIPVFKNVFWVLLWGIVNGGIFIFGTLLLERRFARKLTVRQAQALHNDKVLDSLLRADRLTLRRIRDNYKRIYPHLDDLQSLDDSSIQFGNSKL